MKKLLYTSVLALSLGVGVNLSMFIHDKNPENILVALLCFMVYIVLIIINDLNNKERALTRIFNFCGIMLPIFFTGYLKSLSHNIQDMKFMMLSLSIICFLGILIGYYLVYFKLENKKGS